RVGATRSAYAAEGWIFGASANGVPGRVVAGTPAFVQLRRALPTIGARWSAVRQARRCSDPEFIQRAGSLAEPAPHPVTRREHLEPSRPGRALPSSCPAAHRRALTSSCWSVAKTRPEMRGEARTAILMATVAARSTSC